MNTPRQTPSMRSLASVWEEMDRMASGHTSSSACRYTFASQPGFCCFPMWKTDLPRPTLSPSNFLQSSIHISLDTRHLLLRLPCAIWPDLGIMDLLCRHLIERRTMAGTTPGGLAFLLAVSLVPQDTSGAAIRMGRHN